MPDCDTHRYSVAGGRFLGAWVASMILYPVAVIRGGAWRFSLLLPLAALGQWWTAFDDIRHLPYRGHERAMASAIHTIAAAPWVALAILWPWLANKPGLSISYLVSWLGASPPWGSVAGHVGRRSPHAAVSRSCSLLAFSGLQPS